MKKIILIALVFVTSIYLQAQNTFETLISGPEDQIINCITQDSNGNFIAVGRIYQYDNDIPSGYIIKLNEQGQLINESRIQVADTIANILFNVHFVENSYYLMGSSIGSEGYRFLWYLKLDNYLEILDEKELAIPSDRWFSYMNSILDSDSNFVLTGYTTRPDTLPISPYNNDPFFYKLSITGDSLVSKFNTTLKELDLCYDIIEKLDQTGYYAYGRKFNPDLYYAGQRYELGKNLDSIYIDTVPRLIHDYFSPKRLKDSSILVCGSGGFPDYSPPYSLNVLSTTEENIEVNYNHFKIDGNERDYPAVYNGVSVKNDNIYIGGTSNFDNANPFFSSFDSWYHLIKVDEDINPIWEYWYGGDAYYQLYSILATSDGGCIIVGNRYDDQVQQGERDIYVVKVNSEGLMVGTPEEQIAETHQAIVFPNPGTSQLKVRIAIQHPESIFGLYDMNGKQVLQENIIGQWGEINTTFLPAGTYIYRISDSKGLFESGKWVKQ